MIVKMLEARGSCAGALDYSEKKVSEFVASVAHVRNLPDNLPQTIYNTLLSYEANPRVATQTRDFRFHMAVNPGPADNIDRKGVIDFIDRLMDELGYSEQPYVVYQHNDIDREHYHIVSVRVDRDGRSINRSFDAKTIIEFAKGCEKKYGFTLGAVEMDKEKMLALDSHLKFNPTLGDTYSQMRRVFQSACLVRVTSEEHFRCVMQAKGLSCEVRQGRDGRKMLVLQGVSPDGEKTTRPVTMETTLRYRGYEDMKEWVAEGKRAGLDEMTKKRAEIMINDALDNTPTAEHFRRYLQELGYETRILRAEAFPQPIERVDFYDEEHGAAFGLDELPAQLAYRISSKESLGEWQRSSRREGQLLRLRNLVTPEKRELLQDRVVGKAPEKAPEKIQQTTTKTAQALTPEVRIHK